MQQVIAGQNADIAKGQLSSGDRTVDILTNDQISKARYYKPLVVGYHNGGAVRLEDVADVIDSQQSVRQAGYLNGGTSVNLIIYRQPGANIITTVDAIKAAIPSLQASIPAGEHIFTILDRTLTIRASVNDIEMTLMISVVLVILVVFLFLRNLPATLVPAVAVPVSLIGTCVVMYLCGFSLDNLSLMALAIASGFVVDDAIVVMENISRHIEDGMTPLQASLRGAQEIGFTVFSISISLIAVFIPLLLMGGIIGRLFREFAITLSAAILVSMVISLTTTPMMCSRLMRSEHDVKHGRMYKWSESMFNDALQRVPEVADVGTGSSGADAADICGDAGAECVPDHDGADGFLSAAGYGRDHGRDAGAAGHFVLRDEQSGACGGPDHRARPGRG